LRHLTSWLLGLRCCGISWLSGWGLCWIRHCESQ
jgi:hypothetical protein